MLLVALLVATTLSAALALVGMLGLGLSFGTAAMIYFGIPSLLVLVALSGLNGRKDAQGSADPL